MTFVHPKEETSAINTVGATINEIEKEEVAGEIVGPDHEDGASASMMLQAAASSPAAKSRQERKNLQQNTANHPTYRVLSVTCLRRQGDNASAQPGAFRMRGATHDIVEEEDQTIIGEATTTEAIQPPCSETLFDAELVEEIKIDEESRNVDLEQGRHGVVQRSSIEVLTASPLQDKQILSHFLKQRRVRIFIAVLFLAIIGLVAGMVVGLAQEAKPQDDDTTAILVISNNGTETFITDDNVIDDMTESGEGDDYHLLIGYVGGF